MLRYAQELMSHTTSSSDVPAVFKRALKVLIAALEKQKFAATDRPRRRTRRSTRRRHIPAEVKCIVWERDQGQCTFVSAADQRCPSRTRLEFDHIVEVARSGR